MREKTISFPWGQIGMFLSILFWLIAAMTGTVGAYGVRPSGLAAFACIGLFAGAVVCGGIALFRPGLQNRLLGAAALTLTLLPVEALLFK